jgi:error-prone DNA polymerase
MGFYAPAQILRDAQNHGVQVVPIDANHSSWDCTVTVPDRPQEWSSTPTQLRLGLRLVRGLRRDQAETITRNVSENGTFESVEDLWNRSTERPPHSSSAESKLHKATLTTLARADAFASITTSRQGAHWEVQELPKHPAPLDALFTTRHHPPSTPHNRDSSNPRQCAAPPLPASTLQGEMFQDYATTGISLRAHPLQFYRPHLNQRGVYTAASLLPESGLRSGTIVSAAGIPIVRQRPGTAKGVVFLTLEDETGLFNVILRPQIFEQHQKIVMYAPYLLATGKLERIGAVVYVDAAQVQELQGAPTRAYAG